MWKQGTDGLMCRPIIFFLPPLWSWSVGPSEPKWVRSRSVCAGRYLRPIRILVATAVNRQIPQGTPFCGWRYLMGLAGGDGVFLANSLMEASAMKSLMVSLHELIRSIIRRIYNNLFASPCLHTTRLPGTPKLNPVESTANLQPCSSAVSSGANPHHLNQSPKTDGKGSAYYGITLYPSD